MSRPLEVMTDEVGDVRGILDDEHASHGQNLTGNGFLYNQHVLLLAGSALGLGFLHGLGADHLMAIAALSVDGRSSRARVRVVHTAFGFALGHMLVLAAGASVAVIFGVVVPDAVSSVAERIGGALLVALGAIGAWSVVSGRAYTHIHPEADGRARLHLHLSGGTPVRHAPHAHSPVPTLMGALFAFSSLRALMLLQPFGASAQSLALPGLLVLIGLFGVGILLSMSLFGVVLARAFSLRAVERMGQGATFVVALASIALGVYWMVS